MFSSLASTRVLASVLIIMLALIADAANGAGGSPLRTWGDFTSVYRTLDVDSGAHTSSNWLNTLTMNASSYLWRPWFASMSGSLSLSVDQMESDDEAESRDEFSTGKVQFNLFPSSRFPFMLYANKSRSELEFLDFTRELTTYEYGVIQSYRTEDGKHNFRLSFRDNEKTRPEDEISINAQNLSFSSGSHLGANSLYTEIQADNVTNEDQESNIYSLTGRHSYNNERNFSFNNVVSTSRNESDFDESFSNVDTAQYSGLLSWRPEQRSDINVTGSLRLADLKIDQFLDQSTDPQGVIENSTINLNQGLIYRFSNALTFSESVNVTETRANDLPARVSASESLTANYTPERLDLAIGDYGWSASTGVTNQHGDLDNTRSQSLNLSHSLANDIFSDADSSLRSNLNQSASHSRIDGDEKRTRVDHSFSITWNSSAQDSQSVLRFQASDSRSVEGDENQIQLLNLQYSGHLRISRYSRLMGNITLQHSRQADGLSESKNTVRNGQIDYERDRVFNIARMNFKSQLKLNSRLSEAERLQEEILLEESASDASWKNVFTYFVGRLEMEMHLEKLKHGDQYDTLIRFQLTRSFGEL